MTHQGKRILVSGGFDPIHVGHVRMFQDAKARVGREGTLIVVLNGDSWLERKKGKRFMPQEERAEIIKALLCVDEVYVHESEADDVSEALRILKPHIFANGGDRIDTASIPEAHVCDELGIEMLFNVGGGKIQSSSWLLSAYEG
jgi:D-beta-D-heptose 7-phosphate kinase/D-beta-D-heptose 1-phosphate adenosyltransferase